MEKNLKSRSNERHNFTNCKGIYGLCTTCGWPGFCESLRGCRAAAAFIAFANGIFELSHESTLECMACS